MSVKALKRGGYRVDVQYKGQRVRERVEGSYDDALAREKELREQLVKGVDIESARPSQARLTMRELYRLTVQENWQHRRDKNQMRRAKKILDEFIGWDTDPHDVNAMLISQMAEFYRKRGNSESTINRKKVAVSTMLTYGRRLELITHKPHMGLRQENNKRERFLTIEEEELLMDALDDFGDELFKDLVTFLLDTGLRVGEALAAKANWVLDGYIRIPSKNSKNNKPRLVPLSPRALAIVPKTGYLFPRFADRGTRHLYTKMERVVGMAGIDESDCKITFHVLRHTCASRLVMAGYHIREVQTWLGHTKIETTERYTHLPVKASGEMLNKLMERFPSTALVQQ